jgi:hypothetical protein
MRRVCKVFSVSFLQNAMEASDTGELNLHEIHISSLNGSKYRILDQFSPNEGVPNTDLVGYRLRLDMHLSGIIHPLFDNFTVHSHRSSTSIR